MAKALNRSKVQINYLIQCIKIVQHAMSLDHWDLTLSDKEPDDEDNWAEVFTPNGQCSADIKIAQGLIDEHNSKVLCYYLGHELGHLVLKPLWKSLLPFLQKMENVDAKIMMEAHEIAEEDVADYIGTLVSKHVILPKIPWKK